VSLEQLRRWNKFASGIKVTPGEKVHVAEPVAARHSRGRRRTTITAEDLNSHAKGKSSAHAKAAAGEKNGSQADSAASKHKAHSKASTTQQK
jgi:hypothetical protein